MIYVTSQKGPFKVSGYHDPDSIRPVIVILRPDTWQAATVYRYVDSENFDIVLPPTYKGYAQFCVNGGISGATAPTFALEKDALTTEYESGLTTGLTWKAVPYNFMLATVNVSDITYSATNGVTLSNTSNTTARGLFTIDEISSTAAARSLKKFEVRLRILFDSGQRDDYTMQFKIAER